MGVITGTLGAGVLLLVREPVAEVVLGSHEQSQHIALLAPTLLTAATASVITGVLVGLRRLRTATMVMSWVQ